MNPTPEAYQQLLSEIQDLRFRLEEAEETIRAIRSGEVDALVVSTAAGEQVFTLRSADYYYRVLVEAMSEGAVTVDPEGMVLYSNSRFAELVGTPLQKVIGASFDRFVLPGERQAFSGLIHQGMESPSRSEFTLYFAGEVEIPALLSAYPLAMDPPAVCIIVSDQSERKRAMEALRDSEARFRLLADNSSDMISRFSLDGVCLYVSPACRTLLGYEPGELVGTQLNDLIHPDDREKNGAIFGESSGQGELFTLVYRLRQKQGTYIWVETTGRVANDPNIGTNPEIQTDTRDISERKRAEEQILEQNSVLGWFNQISAALSNSLNLGDILSTVRDHLRDLVGIPAGTIYLFNKETDKLEARLSWRDEVTASLALPLPRMLNQTFEKTGVVYRLLKHHSLPDLRDGNVWGKLQIPLKAQTQLQGVIELVLRVRPEAVQNRIEIIEMFGRELGMALHNAALYDAEQQSRNLAETLRDASQALARSLSMEEVLNTFLDVIWKLVAFDNAAIYLFDNESHLVPRIRRGPRRSNEPGGNLPSQAIPLENPHIQAVISGRHSLSRTDSSPSQDWDARFVAPGMHSFACVPILAGERLIAVCWLSKKEKDFYKAEHLRWLDTLARQATTAIQNAWLFEQVRAGREKLQSLTRRLVEVQEKERRYVAQELHDDAGQALTALILRIGALKQDVANPEAVKAHAAYLGEEAASVLENLHRLAMDLRPATLDHLGLVAALRQYREIIASQCNLDIQFEAIGFDKRLSVHTEVALYRIVQEALTNVIRHAKASRVDILLERHEGRIVVIVEDNGIGFGAETELKPGHLGLIGMQERAEMLGGKLTIESRPGKGTTILIEIPSNKNHEE